MERISSNASTKANYCRAISSTRSIQCGPCTLSYATSHTLSAPALSLLSKCENGWGSLRICSNIQSRTNEPTRGINKERYPTISIKVNIHTFSSQVLRPLIILISSRSHLYHHHSRPHRVRTINYSQRSHHQTAIHGPKTFQLPFCPFCPSPASNVKRAFY